jgi:hypothetical protein
MDLGILIALASGAATLLTVAAVLGWLIWREVRRARRSSDAPIRDNDH